MAFGKVLRKELQLSCIPRGSYFFVEMPIVGWLCKTKIIYTFLD
jgi:hypothetical protein